MAYSQIWDLESIFKGGSDSTEYKAYLKGIHRDVANLTEKWSALEPKLSAHNQAQWVEVVGLIQNLEAKIEQAYSFVGCLLAQDTDDEKAQGLESEMIQAETKVKVIQTQIKAAFAAQEDDAWKNFTQHPEMAPIQFWLDKERNLARKKLPADKEALIAELAADGYTAWGVLYDRISGDLRVDFEDEDGTIKRLSMGQLSSKMSHPNRAIRKQAFEKMEAAWKGVLGHTAMSLNHLAGFRWTMYQQRGWDDILEEAYAMSRISPQTLQTMWQVIAEERGRMAPYFEHKAKLLGIDKLAWFDCHAPVGATEKTYTYDEACDFIVEQMGKFSPQIATYCQMAVDKAWIEAEDRSGKQAGAFCTGLPEQGESRVFMTFTKTYDNLSTLAHELGHGYHSWVLRDLPILVQQYPMTLAETASTFNETVVADGAYQAAQTDPEKLNLLDNLLQNAIAFFMNIHARFLFETRFYAERQENVVSVDRLNELMITAQKEAYCDLLDEHGYHPYFWASKLHFYIPDVPFYNFPYTFGYLFSNGLYVQAKKEGAGFAEKYDAMLMDTGRMTCEEVVRKHLHIDITRPEFWRETVQHILGYVDDFVMIAQKMM